MDTRSSTKIGIQDDGEEGVADVNYHLYNSSNEELGTDTTDRLVVEYELL